MSLLLEALKKAELAKQDALGNAHESAPAEVNDLGNIGQVDFAPITDLPKTNDFPETFTPIGVDDSEPARDVQCGLQIVQQAELVDRYFLCQMVAGKWRAAETKDAESSISFHDVVSG